MRSLEEIKKMNEDAANAELARDGKVDWFWIDYTCDICGHKWFTQDDRPSSGNCTNCGKTGVIYTKFENIRHTQKGD